MAEDPSVKIKNFLKENNVEFEVIEHEPVYTSEQAAQVRGIAMEAGAKSLLLKGKDGFILAILPGSNRLDSKKVKSFLGSKDLRFATPLEVKDRMDCEIGACYPFGNLIDLKMVVDPSLSKHEVISFNPGLHHESIKINWSDYERIIKPELLDISQE